MTTAPQSAEIASTAPHEPLLECRGLAAGYSGKPVVRNVDLVLQGGEILTILGPNGAGKTTMLVTIAGLRPAIAGSVFVNGGKLRNGNSVVASRRGVVLVPDDRALFTTLTTRENLQLGIRKNGMGLDEIVAYFPLLERRLDVTTGLLSGGEQQMLAIGRGLAQRPRVLLIDELSMGLAPVIVEELLPVIRRISADTNAAVVLVEQHVRLALGIADRALVLVHGQVAIERDAVDLLADMTVVEEAYLGDATTPSSSEGGASETS